MAGDEENERRRRREQQEFARQLVTNAIRHLITTLLATFKTVLELLIAAKQQLRARLERAVGGGGSRRTLRAALEQACRQSSSSSCRRAATKKKPIVSLVLLVVLALWAISLPKQVNDSIDSNMLDRSSIDSLILARGPSGRPKLTFHVGIPATETAFLQSALCDRNTTKLLLSDNLVYLGTCTIRGKHSKHDLNQLQKHFLLHHETSFFDRTRGEPGFTDLVLHQKIQGGGKHVIMPIFKKRVLQMYSNGHDVILSYEGASAWTYKKIETMASFLQPAWVQIVIGYTPLYEWVVNYHDHYDVDSQHRHTALDLTDPNAATTRIFSAMEAYQRHPAQLVRDMFRQSFDNIQILPFHQLPKASSAGGDEVLEYLFCTLLGTKKKICKEVKKGSIVDHQHITPKPINYLLLADYAKSNRLIRREPLDLVQEIRQYNEVVLKRTQDDFTLVCPPNQLVERLERLSLEVEHKLLGASSSDADQIHQQGFAEMVQKGKFCHIDLSATVRDENWQKFFQTFQ